MRRWGPVIALLAALLGSMVAAAPAGPSTEATPATLRTLAAARGIRIGSAVNITALATDDRYRDTLHQQFDSVTAENAMKWSRLETAGDDAYDWSAADYLVETAESFGQKIRGHTLAWHNSNPTWTSNLSAAERDAAMLEHVRTTVSRYAGRVDVWDVVNEPISDKDDARLRDYWTDLGGEDAIVRVFEAARAADPTARLYLNDYNVEHAGAKSDAYYALAARLKSRGLLDGVGFQTHLTTRVNEATGFRAVLQRFADLGVEVAVTELDVRVPMAPTAEEKIKQRLLFRRATNACLAVSRCVSVTVWGFTDSYSWANADDDPEYGNATLYDTAIEAKGTYWAVYRALARRDVDTQVVAGHSGRCLHVVNGSTEPGAKLQQYTCTGSTSQVFRFRRLDPRTFQITNTANGLCLGIDGASRADRAKVIQESCVEGAPAQTFVLRPATGDGTGDGRQYQIVAQHSGKCVEVRGANLTNSGRVEQSACHRDPAHTDNQVWTVLWGHL